MDKQNNFNILRLIFASTVIISHSFPLTKQPEFFLEITNQQIDLGRLSVEVFFVISGYLIYNSLSYSKSLLGYLWKRVLRLFPALIVMLLVTMGIILLVNKSDNMLHQTDFYTYLPRNLSLYYVQYAVSGVFVNNPYPYAINGSLWTLAYEFSMYLVLTPLYFTKNNNIRLGFLSLLFAFFGYCYLAKPLTLQPHFAKLNLISSEFYRLGSYFIAGSLLTFFNIKSIKTNKNILLLLTLILVSIFLNIYNIIALFALPLLIILIGISFNKRTWTFSEQLGDISYGIYIYGFLVQQTLMNYFELGPIELMCCALVLTCVPAYLSWHLIEKKALKFKNKIQ
jgi:peptidoglycan/LPS O-acetylase OafA/YrhL